MWKICIDWFTRSLSNRPRLPLMSTCSLPLDWFSSHTVLAAKVLYFTEQLEAWLGRGAISAWTSPQFQSKTMHLLGQRLKIQEHLKQNTKWTNYITCFTIPIRDTWFTWIAKPWTDFVALSQKEKRAARTGWAYTITIHIGERVMARKLIKKPITLHVAKLLSKSEK